METFEGEDNRQVIAEVIKRLPVPVIAKILEAMTVEYGIVSKVKFVCAGCRFSDIVEMPFNEDFFTKS